MDNRELTTFAHSTLTPEKMTPDEARRGHTLERSADVAASSPYLPGPAGDGKHDGGLADAITSLINNRLPQERPSSPVADAGAGAPSPERPPAATSTAAVRPQAGDARARSPASRPRSAAPRTTPATFTRRTRGARRAATRNSPIRRFRDYYQQVYGQDPGKHPARELKDDPESPSAIFSIASPATMPTRSSTPASRSRGQSLPPALCRLRRAHEDPQSRSRTPIERILSAEGVIEPIRSSKASRRAKSSHGRTRRWAAHARRSRRNRPPASSRPQPTILWWRNCAPRRSNSMIRCRPHPRA
jgi:hypothetical protein